MPIQCYKNYYREVIVLRPFQLSSPDRNENYKNKINLFSLYNMAGSCEPRRLANIPGSGTAVTTLQTAQHTDFAPTG